MENKILYKLGNSTVFEDGNYKQDDGVVGVSGSVWEYEDIVSAQFNQLKGKLFNLIEMSPLVPTQCEAMKGIVKDFCNEKYRDTIGDLDGLVERLGFQKNHGSIGGREE